MDFVWPKPMNLKSGVPSPLQVEYYDQHVLPAEEKVH